MMQRLAPYLEVLRRWIPEPQFGPAPVRQPVQFDATLAWQGPQGVVRYLVQEKRHLAQQDVRLVVERLKREQRNPGDRKGATAMRLLLAPYIRRQQAEILEQAGVDYLDLEGNVHLHGPGLLLHVEGRRPVKQGALRVGRVNKGWVKTVLAFLVNPDTLATPYRAIAEEAGVALGTITGCLADLTRRGLLRNRNGQRVLVDRQKLLELWVQGYVDTLRPKLEERRLQVRAANKAELWNRLVVVLGRQDIEWALTGADAADVRTHYFQAEETEVYAPTRLLDDRALQAALIAQPAARTGNLLVIEPPAPAALRTTREGSIPVAADVLAYAELRYRATTQALEAAEVLLPRVLG